MITAIYPGSFDPVTIGHLDIINRASKLYDKLIVAVLVNPQKAPAFSAEERVALIKKCIKGKDNIEVICFDGLLADYTKKNGVDVIIKGLRAMSDFEYEFQMALTNRTLNPDTETVFLCTSAKNMFLSSSMVKQVASFGGDISHFVPEEVLSEIEARIENSNK